jgi:hypothetical protein
MTKLISSLGVAGILFCLVPLVVEEIISGEGGEHRAVKRKRCFPEAAGR